MPEPGPFPRPDRRENYALRQLIVETVKTDGLADRFALRAEAALCRARAAARRIHHRVCEAVFPADEPGGVGEPPAPCELPGGPSEAGLGAPAAGDAAAFGCFADAERPGDAERGRGKGLDLPPPSDDDGSRCS